jgi:HD-like signal output (HDOD) protein
MPASPYARAVADLAPGEDTDRLARDIGIPARPELVLALQEEIARDEPDLRRIGMLVSADIAMTAAVLRIVNSPAYALTRHAESVDHAIMMLGLRQICTLVTGLMLRKVLRTEGLPLRHFWDTSAKRSHAMAALARRTRTADADMARTCGLFCDVGMVLLTQQLPAYGQTLKVCHEDAVNAFTAIEQLAHGTDHALAGGLMARTWGASPTVCAAIRLHHDYTVFQDGSVPEAVARLVALNLVAETAIQRFANLDPGNEWRKGGEFVAGALVMSEEDVDDAIGAVTADFAAGLG